jgi:ATP synthase protein I
MKLFKGLDRRYLDNLLRASLIGVHMVASTFVGLAMGYFLDKWLNTGPWLTMLFLFFGIAGGFTNMFREVKRIDRGDRESGGSDER